MNPASPAHEVRHVHVHAHRGAAASKTVRLILAILIPAALATVIGLILLWPSGTAKTKPVSAQPHFKATVLAVHQRPCPGVEGSPASSAAPVCGDVVVRADTGPRPGAQLLADLPFGPGAPVLETGDAVIVMQTEQSDTPGSAVYSIIDHDRSSGLWALVLAFVLAVVAFGRWRGLTALAGLAITFAMLLLFVVPAILQGKPPLWVAIAGSAAIMLVVLYLTHGVNIPTSMAVLGTLASLALTGALAAASSSLLKLTGVASEEASFLTMQFPGVNMLGLLLAGIIIGALGVLDDVTVTQAYTVTELAEANPALGFTRLYAAASRIGRAHITSVINTIVLAYAGASLPVLLLLTAGGASVADSVTSEWLTQEIVRSIVGTIGLIAAVPITTALAAAATAHREHRRERHPRVGRPHRQEPQDRAWSRPQ